MDSVALIALLDRLLVEWESEVVEFKRGRGGFSSDDLGKYVTALANEANLRAQDRAWLVFGVDNKARQVCGTDYKRDTDRLQADKQQVLSGTGSFTVREIHVLAHPQGRVVLFEIPAAPQGMPIHWKGHHYGRAGESLGPLGPDKLDEIRAQTLALDWSAQRVDGATLADLDEAALAHARMAFGRKYANRFSREVIDAWPLSVFLERARLTLQGELTQAVLLLLGKAESAVRLSPHPAEMSWKLAGVERAYEHFRPPFLLTSTELYRRIRNVQIRLLPQDQLLPVEVSKYDQKVVLEALHNCIAHQDYSRNGRIVVTEQADRLLFENEGGFFEGQPADYLEGNRVPRRYRNPFLAQAMVELNMIDTMGFGIHDIHALQARRYLPMPDYDLGEPDAVRLTVYGGVVDPAYSRLLIKRTDLPLADVLALDRVQKKLPIPPDAVRSLRRAGLVEGRKPHLHVAATVAKVTAGKADYIRNRAQDDAFYAKLLTDYLDKFGHASRAEIDQLLLDKLSDALSEKQKTTKISTLLTKLRKNKVIVNVGSDTASRWELTK